MDGAKGTEMPQVKVELDLKGEALEGSKSTTATQKYLATAGGGRVLHYAISR